MKPLFRLTFLVNADQMAELILDHAKNLETVAVDNGKPEVKHRASPKFPRAGHFSPLVLTGKQPNANELFKSSMIAMQAAQKFCAGKSTVARGALTPVIAKALGAAGFKESGASPAISDLVRRGYLKVSA